MKAVVLLSGGLDSATCLSLAVAKYGAGNVSCLSVFYGQKHEKELESAKKIAAFYGVPRHELNLSEVLEISNCALLAKNKAEVQSGSYAEQLAEGGVQTYVPFRNGLFLAAVASFAYGLYNGEETAVYLGAHADDAAGNAYADCSPEFSEAMKKAISLGTYGKIKVETPLINMNKAQVVKTGLELGTPYELTWSCYRGGDKPCGKCGTCIDRARAFEMNEVKDPALGEV